MSIHLRKLIGSRINELTPVKKSITSLLELNQNKEGHVELKLPFTHARELRNCDIDWKKVIEHDMIKSIEHSSSEVSFILHQKKFAEETFNNPTNVKITDTPKKYIVEFSSPNIAKPFHMGHLRSTIIGNFLANLFTVVNHNVIKMNYLGDYGTQFGFLQVGIEMENFSKEQIREHPLECLFKAYVTANASTDPKVAENARKVFETMEKSEGGEVIQQWVEIKQYTMDELKIMYERLNVVFDVYESESMYRKKSIENVIEQLRSKNLLVNESDGRISVSVGERRVPIIKSDSSSLYLTRDVAAYLERKKRYEMDKIFYVVDHGQHDHFLSLKSIVNDLGFDAQSTIEHVKFGRISGMSTRKGSVVFLKDILDEAKNLMYKSQQETSTTKVDLEKCGETVADILGGSAVVVNDLKLRRTKGYDFEWNKILQVNGDTGVKLQYAHCRLHSLNESCGVDEAKTLDLHLLQEPEAQRLIFEIMRYPENILICTETLEAYCLVKYLFHLCNSTSRALKVLRIKGAEIEVAQQRLLMFNTSRKVLQHGLEILGLKVLKEM